MHLSALVLLRDHLTEQSHEELVDSASGKTKRELLQILANRFPRPDVPSTIRKLPDNAPSTILSAASTSTPTPPSSRSGALGGAAALGAGTITTLPAAPALKVGGQSDRGETLQPSLSTPGSGPLTAERVAPTRMIAQRASGHIEPLSASRHKLQLTISNDVRTKIERATELMRHRNPSGDVAAVLERALDLLIANLEKERLGKTTRPQKQSARPAKPDHVTRSARREVYARYGEQCAFVDSSGQRCPSRSFLEIDHIHPRALGGSSNPENLRLLCRPHNLLRAEEIFGREHVASRIHFRQERSPAPSTAPRSAVAIGTPVERNA